MPKVRVKQDEPLEKALRRFKKKMDKEGLLKQIKRHAHYEKPSQRRRRKQLKARAKARKTAAEQPVQSSF